MDKILTDSQPFSKSSFFNVVFFDCLQWLAATVAFILFFQGKGSHGVFIAIIALVPVIRFSASSKYRLKCRTQLLEMKNALENFSHLQGKAQIPYSAVFTFSVVPLLLVALINGISISSMDNYPTVATAVSLLTEGNGELSELTPQKGHPELVCTSRMPIPYWLRCTPTGAYSAYPLGMLAFAGPVVIVSKLFFGNVADATVQWRLQKWTASWVAGLSAAFFFIIALHFVSLPAAWIGMSFLIFASTVLSTQSQGLWTQGGVVFGFLLAFLIEFRISAQEKLQKNKLFLMILIQGLSLAIAFASRLSSVALLVPFGIWLFIRSPWRALLTTVLAIFFHAPLSFYYAKVYGNFLGPQMQMGQSHGLAEDPFSALLGLLFSPSHGLLIYQPWILLLLVFVSPQMREYASAVLKKTQSSTKGWQWLFVFAIVFHLALVSLWPCWWGGECWGSRLLAEIVPLIAVFVLFPVEYLFKTKRSAKKIMFTMLTFSFLFHAPFLYMFAGRWTGDPLKGKVYPSEEARLWDWNDPPFLYPVLRSRYLLSQ